jgi:Swiss Army Knife protein, DSP-PTPase phosphatase domain
LFVGPEEMAISLLLLTRAALESLDEVSPRETFERLVDLLEPREGVQPRRPLVQLPGSLRPSQHEDAQHRDLVVGEVERLVEELPVLRRAAPRTARETRPAAPRETLERLVDLRLGVGDDGIAVGRLVAGKTESVERKRVLVRRRPLLLEEAAEDPKLDRVGIHERSVRCGMRVNLPIRDCYPVADGLLAGEYPGSADLDEAARRLRAFARHGVDVFLDLTHPADPLEPYAQLLGSGARRVAHPIVDLSTTTIPHMVRILDDVDEAIARGQTAYVHCWGGIGRTGTVVGCWLMRHGLAGGDPIARIAELRRDVSDARVPSPQTSAQRAMVRAWKRGR